MNLTRGRPVRVMPAAVERTAATAGKSHLSEAQDSTTEIGGPRRSCSDFADKTDPYEAVMRPFPRRREVALAR